jgi:hypothetical protein
LKYILIGFIALFIFSIVYYLSSGVNSSSNNWTISKEVFSPDKSAMAIVKCNTTGGATVGFYCKLFINMNKEEVEVMMVRTDKIDIRWSQENVLEASFDQGSKIYNFTNVYWNKKTSNEVFVKIREK